ncbi:type II toxin-antitoxin system YhaV family toxin [Acaryochloris sp. IP29b_bin.148]|uniref:type II toxin-antitoxin system YhaV family toxin n=1 Tax=Acaryochloris sp. IP29b_bin.148 TaxID=2969218 RepID=UPI002623B599|nr:type II toxin-antitoxin system YhaV family toxin [Acaryochloris sp. IP29b_bin.148]
MLINGWKIYFLKRLFGQQRRELQAEVKRLKATLSPEDYVRHPTVKLYAAIMRAIKEKIPMDPFAVSFALTGPLKKFGRVKKMGIPNRYRLFFRAFRVKQSQSIFVLWLGYPRKEGAKNDCYKVFQKMVERGDFPTSLDELMLESDQG